MPDILLTANSTREYIYNSDTRKTFISYRYIANFPGYSIGADGTEIDRYCEGFTLTKILYGDLSFTDIDARLHEDSEFNLNFEVIEDATSCGFGNVSIGITDIQQEIDGSNTDVSILGYTSNTSLTYSIDGTNYQVSNVFTIANAAGGVYVAYIKDDLNYIASQEFDLQRTNTYGTIYRHEFDDESGATWICDIQELDYAGAVTEVDGSASSLQITTGNTGVDKYDVVKGSGARLQLNSSTDFKYLSLFSATDLTYKLVATKDGETFFEGLINNEAYSEPYTAPGYFVNFEFLDGLGRLKRYAFERPGGKQFEGLKSELEILKICLLNTGLQLPIHEAIDITETNIVRKLSDGDGQLLSQTEYYGTHPFTEIANAGDAWYFDFVGYEDRLANFFNATGTTHDLRYTVDMVAGNSYTIEFDIERTDITDASLALYITFGNSGYSTLVAGYTLPLKSSVYYKATFVADRNFTYYDFTFAGGTSGDGIIINRAFLTETVLSTTLQPARNPLAYVNIDCGSFYDDDSGKADTCYDVLGKILAKYGARISQQNGVWNILNIDLLQSTTHVKERHTAFGGVEDVTLNSNATFIDGLTSWNQTVTAAADWSAFAGYVQNTTSGWSEILYQNVEIKAGVPVRLELHWFHNGTPNQYVDFWIYGDVPGTSDPIHYSSNYGGDGGSGSAVSYVYWWTPSVDYANVGVSVKCLATNFSLSAFYVSTHFERVSPQFNLLNASSNPVQTFVDKKQTLSLKPGYKKATLFSKIKLVDNLVTNGDMNTVDNSVVSNWSASHDDLINVEFMRGADSEKIKVLRIPEGALTLYDEYVQSSPSYFNSSGVASRLNFSVRYYNRNSNANFNLFLRVQLGAYYLQETGTWTTTVYTMNIGHSNVDANTWIDRDIYTDEVPTSGNIVVTLYASPVGEMHFDYVRLMYAGGDEEIPDKKEVTIINDEDYTFVPADREFYFIDLDEYGSAVNGIDRAMYINNAETTSSSWSRYGEGENQKILQLLANRIMNNHQRPTQVLAGDIRGNISIGSRVVDTINQANKIFIVSSVNYDANNDIKSVELVEIISESVEGSYDFLQLSSGAYMQLSNAKNIRKS